MKFKEGDRVRVIEGYEDSDDMEVGTCIFDPEYDSDDRISLVFDKSRLNSHFSKELDRAVSDSSYYEYQLEYATMANTEIARKLYPNAKVVNNGKELQL